MHIFDAATSAATALSWYHLSPEKQYVGGNVHLYDAIATLGDRESYANVIAGITSAIEGEVLEIGAGTGIVSKALAAQHGDRLLCTDIEPSTLVLNAHTRKRVADCRELPVDSGSVDAVVGVGVYRYLRGDTANKFWPEMHRVIKHGGKLVLGEFHPRIIGIRGPQIGDAQIEDLFSTGDCYINPVHKRVGGKTMRIGTYLTYTLESH